MTPSPEDESNYGQPQRGLPPVSVPTNVWISAALVTMCCCQPAGIMALVFAAIAASTGTTEPEKAYKFLGYANTATVWGMVLGVAWILIVVTFQIIAVLASG